MSKNINAEIKDILPNWSIVDNKLSLQIKTKHFQESMHLANLITFIAERHDHHPDLLIKYSSITIELYTHTTGTITEKDLQLAKKINELIDLI